MRLVLGYRKMTGFSQKEMASNLGMSEVTYRNKEKGKKNFNEVEIKTFYEIVKRYKNDITIGDIFLIKNDAKKTG